MQKFLQLSSPNLPPRDISPPPLPPRRDSLHIRQSSADGTRIMMSFGHISPFLPSLTGIQDVNGGSGNAADAGVVDKRRFGRLSF